MTIQQTRRETLKQIGFVSAASGVTIPVFAGAVSATESGNAELTLTGSIPDGTQVDATIEEYDTESSSTPITTQSKTITSAGSTTAYGDLDAQDDYYYLFDLTLGSGGNSTPELDALLFEIPPDFTNTDYTEKLEWRAKAEGTTIEFDERYLWKYQPMLRMEPSTREHHKGMYGYVARNEDRETDALCFWSQLTHQDGLPMADSDSHLGDHEPIYVFVNSDDGSVEEVVYSTFHWYSGSKSITDPSEQLQTSRASDPTHAVLSVSEKWHNYSFKPDADGALVELKSWPEVRDTWVRNEFYSPANINVIEDPWQIRDNDGWWEEDSLNAQIAGVYARIGDIIGWYGADEADDWG